MWEKSRMSQRKQVARPRNKRSWVTEVGGCHSRRAPIFAGTHFDARGGHNVSEVQEFGLTKRTSPIPNVKFGLSKRDAGGRFPLVYIVHCTPIRDTYGRSGESANDVRRTANAFPAGGSSAYASSTSIKLKWNQAVIRCFMLLTISC
jgi:hypothetical protein